MFNIGEIVFATGAKLVKGSCTLRVKRICTDSRKIGPGQLFLALKGKYFNGHDFISVALESGANAVLIEEKYFKRGFTCACKGTCACEGISCLIVRDTLKALGDLALYHRRKFSLPIIAITGSSGKTTTKEMIARILDCRYSVFKSHATENNLIGVPLNLLKLNSSHEIACIEFGTSSFGEIAKLSKITRPNVGVITNIGESHLQCLKTKTNIFKEKTSLLKNLHQPSICIVNYDDIYLNKLDKGFKNIFGFGREKRCDFFARQISFAKGRLKFKIAGSNQGFAIKTFGVHNIYNALTAIGIGSIFGISQKSIAKRLATFRFLSSRFKILRFKNFTIIDDTYNANPLSLRYALQSLPLIKPRGKKILVIADMLELGEAASRLHRKMGSLFAKSDIDFIFSFGKLASQALRAALKSGFPRRKVYSSDNLSDLQDKLSHVLENGDLVLVKGSRAMHMERIVKFLGKLKG